MLHISALTYRLGERLLIDNATAALASGAHVGLVGRNGAGKTTLFRLVRGDLAPESGVVIVPKGARIGSVEQEAPAGAESLIDFVLSADTEREALMAEAETASEPERIAEIHTRLVDIEAHNAPARAARILKGLGFDEPAQGRSLQEFSGGWRMRVALAAVLFSEPNLLLLDEPTNYLDLEGVLWLTDYLQSCPATIVVISHDRDLLDDVAHQILHLDRGKLTLWSGGYSSFERQRREQQILAGKAAKKQEERRAHLQAFVDRFRAKASKAVQAQSRLKMLAKMEPVAAIVDESVQPFKWPPVAKRLSPPIVTMDKVSAGYDGRAVIARIDLSLADDDRIGLLGQNGNGKSTFAKLIAGRLEPLAGRIARANRLQVGYFAQHQIDELEPGGSVYDHVAERMRGEVESKIRGRAQMIGFSGARAATKVEALSGGEKARLMMGLAAFDGPQLLILDEPTNHLDIDSRGELIEAINDYEGACILVSHDRRLLEACVDRLWLASNGTVKPFEGDLADYSRFVLGAAERPDQRRKRESAPAPGPARPKREPQPLKREIAALEDKVNRFHDLLRRVDEALAQASARNGDALKIADLAAKRAELERALTATEQAWFELSAEADET
ncbi:MAG TPA: ABC-F family ATP-binding cassette domain-containing protein [Roseiarcus sp.]